jgi:hypothetical protein
MLELHVRPDQQPRSVIAWSATSPTRDFREARWNAQPCAPAQDGFVCRQAITRDQHTALYSEIVFTDAGAPDFSLSTGVCVAGGPEPHDEKC